jgi:hypothetical protein
MKTIQGYPSIYFLLVLSLMMGFVLGTSEICVSQTHQKQLLAEKEYTDPKGFFRISPPLGWRIQEYPQDPRGKVAFIEPENQAELRVLSKAVDIPDYDTLIQNLKNKENELGIKMNIEPLVFKGMPAVKRVTILTMQGITQKFLWIDLLSNGVSHNLQYAATPSLFDKYYESAWKSMLTYEPLKQEKLSSPKEVRRHEVAKWIRLAKIAIEMGKIHAAKEAVAAGLEVDPENEELKTLKSDLDKR